MTATPLDQGEALVPHSIIPRACFFFRARALFGCNAIFGDSDTSQLINGRLLDVDCVKKVSSGLDTESCESQSDATDVLREACGVARHSQFSPTVGCSILGFSLTLSSGVSKSQPPLRSSSVA